MPKINIVTKKTNYAPGDTISGSVDLTLKKPVKARELSISLIGEYKTTRTTRQIRVPLERIRVVPRGMSDLSRLCQMSDAFTESAPKYDAKKTQETVRICQSKQQLDGENEYSEERQYHFEIKLREDTPTGQSGGICWLNSIFPAGRTSARRLI
jgi:hypothetical protein